MNQRSGATHPSPSALATRSIVAAACVWAILGSISGAALEAQELAGFERTRFAGPTRSASIAITSDDRRVVVANQEADTVSVIEVKNKQGQDVFTLLAEIPSWKDPRSVAITPDDREAWVTNAASGTVQVLNLKTYQIVATLQTGPEPRGVALTPNGKKAYVASLTGNTVAVFDAVKRKLLFHKPVGLNPTAIAITNDGDADDNDETVFVTRLFGKPDKGINSEVNDLGRAGFVYSFRVGDSTPTRADIRLSPLADSGFTISRSAFCPQFNGALQSSIFCPDTTIGDPTNPIIAADKQGVFPNQLTSALIRGRSLYLPNIGASPEPPILFNVNLQALVHVVDTVLLAEQVDKHVNLNAQIKLETQPADPTKSLARLFGGDLVDIDATLDGKTFLVLSRGGDYAMKASLVNGVLSIGAPSVVRFRTGHIPTGVVIANGGKRAYTNNSLGYSISALDLTANKVIKRDVQSSEPPATGTPAHALAVGKLAFHSALGVPDEGLLETTIRQIDTLASRNKASDNTWSSCASCHFEGMSDSVTWSFATGPRRTIPLVGSFSKLSPADQRIFNASAVRGSVNDFNENSRAVQGGRGFAGEPPNPNVYNHGIIHGASEALDLMTLWVERIRPFQMPKPAGAPSGRLLFGASCASCHGGAKWTKSQVLYRENPAFDKDPNLGGVPVDPGVLNAGAQVRQVTVDGKTLVFMHDVGTFDTNKAIEMRCCGAVAGTKALGALGFNVPSLLNVIFNGPYLHDGSAETLDDLFVKHRLPNGQTIANSFSPTQLEQLRAFLISIDGTTRPFKSDADTFRDSIEAGRKRHQNVGKVAGK